MLFLRVPVPGEGCRCRAAIAIAIADTAVLLPVLRDVRLRSEVFPVLLAAQGPVRGFCRKVGAIFLPPLLTMCQCYQQE